MLNIWTNVVNTMLEQTRTNFNPEKLNDYFKKKLTKNFRKAMNIRIINPRQNNLSGCFAYKFKREVDVSQADLQKKCSGFKDDVKSALRIF